MGEILYKTDLRDVDRARMKSPPADDDFDNGRTPGQLREALEQSRTSGVRLARADGRRSIR